MEITQAQGSSHRRPLRLWPGVVAAVLLVLVRYAVPMIDPELMTVGMLGGFAGALLILLWWTFLSRAPWSERLAAIVLIIIALAVVSPFLHPSIAGGMMGMMFYLQAIPVLSVAFVAWAVATRRLPDGARRASMVATIVVACAAWGLVRTSGITGNGEPEFHWRWSLTAEERLLAQTAGREALTPAPATTPPPAEASVARAGDTPAVSGHAAPPAVPTRPMPARPVTAEPAAPAASRAEDAPPVDDGNRDPVRVEWAGFRGPGRDGAVRGITIETDWSKSPPVEMWRRPIGPGWSSFAVSGDVLYTQEQRGENEVVAAYRVSTGEPVWQHSDPVRFYESNGGAGPRATPTLSGDRLYSFGATGILNALDASSGSVVWSRNASADTGVKVPGWGFTSSPVVYEDLVIVAVSGAMVAYDRATGEQRWLVPSRGGSYSSPHLATIDGVPQVLLLGGSGARSVAPADGTVLWEHEWSGSPIVQPAVLADGSVVITTADGMGGAGMRRLTVARGPAGWTAEERWTSRGLKPYFNDYVVNDGHAFGFDGRILSCIDLSDGTRKWKGGRYGQGQLILLADQDLLLVLSEEGELALVGATADQFRELARLPALNAKTWNHPVLVGDVLLVRNGEEMAAFRMPLAAR